MKKHSRPQDPSQPLADDRHEGFCQFRAIGFKAVRACQMLGYSQSNKSVEQANASRLDNKPEIKARIQHIISTAQPTDAALDRETIVQKLTVALGKAQSPSDIAQVVGQVLKVKPSVSTDRDESIPDPLAIVTYLCTAADKTPEQLGKEMRGPEWVIGRVQILLRLSPERLMAAAQAVAKTRH